MKALLVGCGKMGKNHLKTLRAQKSINEIVIVDDSVQEIVIKDNERIVSNINHVIHEKYDFAIIATPTRSHVEIASKVLSQKIPSLIEKPIATSVDLAQELLKHKDMCAIGHIERFNPVIDYLTQSYRTKKIKNIKLNRLSQRPTRISDVGVDWDLAVHDLDIIKFLFGNYRKISSTKRFDQNNICTHAEYELKTQNEMLVKITASWEHDDAVRTIDLEDDDKLLTFDLKNHTKIFRDDIKKIPAHNKDQLTMQLESFIDFIQGRETKVCSIEDAIYCLQHV